MPITREAKLQAIQSHRRHDKDSGSTEVQVAILTKDIAELTAHMQRHPKDYGSRHGLLMKVNRRNKLMRYLARVSPEGHAKLAEQLGLRR